eukprot:TRINITY_DN37968_c0_g1_i1.p1 TRINITY_DN37968_c0_g1~~TRINITY_DN37968_c0_g1_i1.p1  ORF type:complete len:163 (+),score=23.21 TRINITY_DN37968_c0_g1_i1:42-491(+)
MEAREEMLDAAVRRKELIKARSPQKPDCGYHQERSVSPTWREPSVRSMFSGRSPSVMVGTVGSIGVTLQDNDELQLSEVDPAPPPNAVVVSADKATHRLIRSLQDENASLREIIAELRETVTGQAIEISNLNKANGSLASICSKYVTLP